MEDDADQAAAPKSLEPLAKVIYETQSKAPTSQPHSRSVRLVGNYEATHHLRNAQWSADGTSIITNGDDYFLRTFVMPANLLASSRHHDLQPYTAIQAPEPVNAFTVYPFYELGNAATTLILSSTRDHPVRLHNALYTAQLATYPLINLTTEEYICPHSLLFTPSGTHFLTGSDSYLACFDISRTGEGPVERFQTIPSRRKKIKGGGVGMKGIVSALSVNSDSILAAGTFTRDIGLYSDAGRGECISVFSLGRDTSAPEYVHGSGITQTAWSPDGRYLYVAERMSDGVSLFDIRVTGKRLAALRGRAAMTNQRLDIDVVSIANSHEIWAGGTDGVVRIWENPHLAEIDMHPNSEWQAHTDATSSAVVHPFGSVVATASGSRGTWRLEDSRAHVEYSLDRNPEASDIPIVIDSDIESVTSGASGSGSPESVDQLTMKDDFSLRLWAL